MNTIILNGELVLKILREESKKYFPQEALAKYNFDSAELVDKDCIIMDDDEFRFEIEERRTGE